MYNVQYRPDWQSMDGKVFSKHSCTKCYWEILCIGSISHLANKKYFLQVVFFQKIKYDVKDILSLVCSEDCLMGGSNNNLCTVKIFPPFLDFIMK